MAVGGTARIIWIDGPFLDIRQDPLWSDLSVLTLGLVYFTNVHIIRYRTTGSEYQCAA